MGHFSPSPLLRVDCDRFTVGRMARTGGLRTLAPGSARTNVECEWLGRVDRWPFAGTRSGDEVAPYLIPSDAVKLGNGGIRQRTGATRDQKIARARDGATIEIADIADLMLEWTWRPLNLGRGDPACMRISAQYGWHCSWPSLAALQAAACRCWRPSPRSRHIAWDRKIRSKSGCSAPMS